MKKIINSPSTVVEEMCSGIILANPDLELLPKYKVLRKKDIAADKVSLISGGGSGHEPAHAGFIGEGLLDAAVCGDVFASPSQIQVYQAIKSTAGKKGVLLIIKNYSGDIMNFQNAAGLAKEDGIEVDHVKVDDDIAVEDSLYTVGRRGVAGTIFVHKIAGAASKRGQSLSEVKRVAEKAVKNMRSLGFALTSCTNPASGVPTFSLEETEMEYGVGIHGEPGIKRETLISANELAARIVKAINNELSVNGEKAALLINGFGGTPLMELYLLNNAVRRELSELNTQIVRTFVGNYMTSIDMAGASVSILKLDGELESLLNDPCDSAALKISGPVETVPYRDVFLKEAPELVAAQKLRPEYGQIGDTLDLNNLLFIVNAMAECIINNEKPFCELDSHAGDGDFGTSVAKGFRELKKEWNMIITQADLDISGFLDACSLVIMEYCGGASGPIWGSAFRAAGKSAVGKKSLTVADFADLLSAAVNGVQVTGERSFGRGAVPGDKTLIDALVPCAEAWKEAAKQKSGFEAAFKAGADAAVAGAKNTESFAARMGRAGTVGERSIGYPDAGAFALGVIFTEITRTLSYK